MNKGLIKQLIQTGKIIHFRDIFQLHCYPRYLVADAIGMNRNTFGKKVKSPGTFKLKHSYRLADYFNVTHDLISQLIMAQYEGSLDEKVFGNKKPQ